jgi:hypothetical protein
LSVLSKPTQAKVLKLTVSTLHQMLTFATTVSIQRHIINRHASDFRGFEAEAAELTDRESIKGTGILATRDEIGKSLPVYEQDFFYNEVPLGAHELGAYISSFPLSAAAASYLFTLLEVFGDEVSALINPGSIDKNKAWHESVKGFADLRDVVQLKSAKDAFAKHFNASGSNVPELAARRMVALKRARNDFAHDGSQTMNYDQFLHDTLALVCHIAFLTTDTDRISVYPWEDHMDIFEPQSKA